MKFTFKNLAQAAAIICAVLTLSGCKCICPASQPGQFSHFIGCDDFSKFTCATNQAGEVVLLSPVISAGMNWNQLVVSWNATAAAGTFANFEASALSAGRPTKYYKMGNWSPDGKIFPRTSVSGQKDADGKVDMDTLMLRQPADAVQIRITLGGTNGARPALKFLGLSFANTRVPYASRPSNHVVWGKIIPTPEHSQHGFPNEKGWCSPTSLSMVMSRWAEVLNRPEMDLSVPQVAAGVYDRDSTATGNWPFNTAFAGSFPGMRGCITRLDDLSEVEDWIAAGIPVILSARWDWLQPPRPADNDGHLIVCIGFTENGDVVINDPSTRLDKGEFVRRIYKRENVIHAWSKSHHAVYLVFPEGANLPENKYGHW